MERDIVVYIKFGAAMIAAFWGGLHVLVQILIVFMALDIATGMLAAYVSRRLDSDVSFRGIAKKAIVLLLVAAAAWLEPAVGIPVGQAVAGFYAAHEGLSVIENAAKAGLPIPRVLRDALAKLSPELSEEEGRRKLEEWRG